MHRLSIVALTALTLVACGGKAVSIPGPVEEEPGPPAVPTSAPTAAPAPTAPVSAGSDRPSTSVTTTPAALRASCDAAKTTLVDGNRWDSTQHFDHAFELAGALPGTWYACRQNPLFSGDGIALHADGSAKTISYDGKTIEQGESAAAWMADDGLNWTGADHFWAVISLDGRQAVMGKPSLGSSEFIFVRVD